MHRKKASQSRHNRTDFDAFLLRQLLIHGPNSESGIKRLERPSDLLYLEKVAYQVKVHRGLTGLERRHLVYVVNRSRTHGGLISKTYSITNLGLMSLLQESVARESLTNRDFFIKQLLSKEQKNDELAPFLSGLVQFGRNSDESEAIEAIIKNFLGWLLSKMGDEPIVSFEKASHSALKILQETLDHMKGNVQLLLQREPVQESEITNKQFTYSTPKIVILSLLDVQFVNYLCDSSVSKETRSAFEKITRLLKREDKNATYLPALEVALKSRRELVLKELRQLDNLMSIIA